MAILVPMNQLALVGTTLCVLSCLCGRAQATAPTDSLKKDVSVWMFTPRFNTLNMAPVSGNIVNNHVNLDLSMVFNQNRFTWMVAKGIDLEDFRSEMNYLLTNVRYKLSLKDRFHISPFLAFYSEQTQQLIDPISDFNGGMIFSWQQGRLTLEAFTLLVRLTHEATRKDLINRFEVRYTWPSLVFSAFAYHNTGLLDHKKRLALGFKATLPAFVVFQSLHARAEITGSFKLTETPETNNLNGVFLSLAFPFKRQRTTGFYTAQKHKP